MQIPSIQPSSGRRSAVVIGASMGGIDALKRLVAQLPAAFPAAVFVVQHVSSDAPDVLSAILDRAGPLPAVTARTGDPVRAGCIYVAPPNRHLLVHDGQIVVSHGPRENRMRPAIDPLFRSAAVAYRNGVVGVLLTGLLDDGVSGLAAIKRCGGVAVVQHPDDAAHPDMPQAALANVEVDHAVALAGMGALLERLVGETAPEPPPLPRDLELEVEIAQHGVVNVEGEDALGTLAPFSCPECGGTLWQIGDEHVHRYRCHVGHGYTAASMVEEQDRVVEQALWVAMRTLEERSTMLARMVRDERAAGRPRMAGVYEERLGESLAHAASIRDLLLGGPETPAGARRVRPIPTPMPRPDSAA